jgi:hypothetical protein
LPCQLREYRGKLFARAAPRRPEIYQYRQFVPLDELAEGGASELNRVVGQHLRVAFATFWLCLQFVGGDAVHCAAVGANEFHVRLLK